MSNGVSNNTTLFDMDVIMIECPNLKAAFNYYTPCFNEVKSGVYTGFTSSVSLSVHLSVDRIVRSVTSIILARFISYLHISLSNFRRCVMCKNILRNYNIWIFGKFFKFVTLTLSCFDLGSDLNQ